MAKPPFAARFDILSSEPLSEALWRIQGYVFDLSPNGYTALDAQIGDLVFCDSYMGDIDRFRVVAIDAFDINTSELTCQVVYDETAEVGIGMPTTGSNVISRDLGNRRGYVPVPAIYGISEYLAEGIRAKNMASVVCFESYDDLTAQLELGKTEYRVTRGRYLPNSLSMRLHGIEHWKGQHYFEQDPVSGIFRLAEPIQAPIDEVFPLVVSYAY